MTLNGGIFAADATVLIGVAGAFSSACTAITANVTNFKTSGGTQEVDSIKVFGGGNIDKILQRDQYELSLDLVPTYGTNSTIFDSYIYGSGLVSSATGGLKVVYVQFTDGTNFHTRAYNNCTGMEFAPDVSAGEEFKGTLRFKLSPTTSDNPAKSNVKIVAAAASTLSWP